jgi:hypothetical protein
VSSAQRDLTATPRSIACLRERATSQFAPLTHRESALLMPPHPIRRTRSPGAENGNVEYYSNCADVTIASTSTAPLPTPTHAIAGIAHLPTSVRGYPGGYRDAYGSFADTGFKKQLGHRYMVGPPLWPGALPGGCIDTGTGPTDVAFCRGSVSAPTATGGAPSAATSAPAAAATSSSSSSGAAAGAAGGGPSAGGGAGAAVSPKEPPSSSSPPVGLIAGGVAAGVVVLGAAAAFVWHRQRRAARSFGAAKTEMGRV